MAEKQQILKLLLSFVFLALFQGRSLTLVREVKDAVTDALFVNEGCKTYTECVLWPNRFYPDYLFWSS